MSKNRLGFLDAGLFPGQAEGMMGTIGVGNPGRINSCFQKNTCGGFQVLLNVAVMQKKKKVYLI